MHPELISNTKKLDFEEPGCDEDIKLVNFEATWLKKEGNYVESDYHSYF